MENDLTNKEENKQLVKRNLKHKSWLIFLKYLPHINALCQIIYTLLEFVGIDAIIFGHIIHMSLVSWLFFYGTSIVFRYCYVHRLPLYYIGINELLTLADYYFKIPISTLNLLILHIVLIGILIFSYTYFYVKDIKDNTLVVDK